MHMAHIQKYLIIVVIEIRICALQLHHLDFGYPLLFFLSHQVTVGISTSAVPSSPAMIPWEQINVTSIWSRDILYKASNWLWKLFNQQTSRWLTHTVSACKYKCIYPAWFCIRWVSIRWCCGWRWVVLCLMAAAWLVGPREGSGAMRWPGGMEPPKNCLKPTPGNKGGAGPVQGKQPT